MTDPHVPSADTPGVEERTLWVGAWSGLALGALGFVFAVLSGSDAILLDGVFSLLGFGVALATIRVSQVIRQPASDRFQFGYSGFESMINVVRGIVMGVVSLFAAASAVGAILAGGRQVEAGAAAIYSAIAATGCLLVARVMHRAAVRTGSPLLALDVRSWLIDAALSAGVGLAFVLAYLIQDTGFAWFVPYTDPALVALLTLFILPVPLRIVREGMHQLLGGAPEPDVQARIDALLEQEFQHLDDVTPRVRMLQAGRLVYVQVYLIVPPDVEIGGIGLLDEVRDRIYEVLAADLPNLTLDVVFTADGTWLQRSIGGTGTARSGVLEA